MSKRTLLLVAVLLACAFVGLPTVAFARGGGGGHSGSSGGGSSHSGGGGGGGFSGGSGGGVGFVPFAGGGGGGAGLALIIVVIVILVIAYLAFVAVRNRPSSDWQAMRPDDWEPVPDTGPYGAAPAAGPDPAIMETVAKIRQADPDFEPETFLQKAEMAFLLVKRAYQDRNIHAGRAYLSPPLWAGWSQEVQALIDRHERPVLENLNVRGMQVPAIDLGEQGDTIQVHLDYVAAPHTVDDQNGRRVTGSTEDQRLGELWSFHRSAGAKTVVSGGATASKCPNCGGLLELNEDGVCRWCSADITSGKYDWVVTRIDQSSFQGYSTPAAFGAAVMSPQDGMAAIKAEDASFDPEAFRARAQQAFFALQTAWQERDLTSSRPFMSPGLYLGWSSQVQQLIELHKKNILEGLRIDALDVAKVVHGQAFDDVTVRIVATCADYEVDEQTAKVIFGSRSPSQFAEYWTFQRSTGAQTTGRNILDKVCPNCGAPLEINQVGECRYCSAAVTSGRFDWVLSRIEQEDEYAG